MTAPPLPDARAYADRVLAKIDQRHPLQALHATTVAFALLVMEQADGGLLLANSQRLTYSLLDPRIFDPHARGYRTLYDNAWEKVLLPIGCAYGVEL